MNEVYLVMFRNRIELKQGLCEVGDRFAHDEEYFPKDIINEQSLLPSQLVQPHKNLNASLARAQTRPAIQSM